MRASAHFGSSQGISSSRHSAPSMCLNMCCCSLRSVDCRPSLLGTRLNKLLSARGRPKRATTCVARLYPRQPVPLLPWAASTAPPAPPPSLRSGSAARIFFDSSAQPSLSQSVAAWVSYSACFCCFFVPVLGFFLLMLWQVSKQG